MKMLTVLIAVIAGFVGAFIGGTAANYLHERNINIHTRLVEIDEEIKAVEKELEVLIQKEKDNEL